MDEKKYPLYVAKIKVIEKRWHGWSPEGFKILPKENTYEKPSGSRLIISSSTHKMAGVWGEEDQSVESQTRVDYIQKEGFRIFISWKFSDKVSFTPERTLEPISGKAFPVQSDLPLQEKELKVGESFTIEPFTMDAGVKYEITLLDIFESKK
jgi:hypothetical protein